MNWLARPGQHTDDWTVLYNAEAGGGDSARRESRSVRTPTSSGGAWPRPRVSPWASPRRGDLFLHVIERGCSDLVLIGITGPLTGRVLIGNADGFWGPNVSSAPDFLAWYERWRDHMAAGQDNRALELTSPQLRAHPIRQRLAHSPWPLHRT
ncbi:hypothetical protein GCM10010309_78690 [Streptomyces violaceochromogenes]|nr:hypothetical protein GCM10010309_78690 [Streptomyces violaceochromogenes]